LFRRDAETNTRDARATQSRAFRVMGKIGAFVLPGFPASRYTADMSFQPGGVVSGMPTAAPDSSAAAALTASDPERWADAKRR